jgi:hypothetical protein
MISARHLLVLLVLASLLQAGIKIRGDGTLGIMR